MKIIYITFAATLTLLVGCAEEKPKQNQVQYDFVRKLTTVKDDLSDLQMSRLLNRGKGGKLPPEDIDQQITAKKAELTDLFGNPPVADSWNASVVSLKRDGGSIVILASYGSILYVLRIVDPVAKKIAENFRDGDSIQFTGHLMAEGSATSIGALISSEFSVYPTKVVRGDLLLTQAEQLAEAGRSVEEKNIINARKQKVASAAEKELKLRIKEICQETILKNLRYPASAYFPKIIEQYEKGSHGNWMYFDVVSAKNELGADIPRRFKCDGQLEGEEVVVRLKFLD